MYIISKQNISIIFEYVLIILIQNAVSNLKVKYNVKLNEYIKNHFTTVCPVICSFCNMHSTYLKVRYRSRALIFCLGTIGRRELPIRESSDSAPWLPLLSALELMLLCNVERRQETSSGAQFASMWMSIFKFLYMVWECARCAWRTTNELMSVRAASLVSLTCSVL